MNPTREERVYRLSVSNSDFKTAFLVSMRGLLGSREKTESLDQIRPSRAIGVEVRSQIAEVSGSWLKGAGFPFRPCSREYFKGSHTVAHVHI